MALQFNVKHAVCLQQRLASHPCGSPHRACHTGASGLGRSTVIGTEVERPARCRHLMALQFNVKHAVCLQQRLASHPCGSPHRACHTGASGLGRSTVIGTEVERPARCRHLMALQFDVRHDVCLQQRLASHPCGRPHRACHTDVPLSQGSNRHRHRSEGSRKMQASDGAAIRWEPCCMPAAAIGFASLWKSPSCMPHGCLAVGKINRHWHRSGASRDMQASDGAAI